MYKVTAPPSGSISISMYLMGPFLDVTDFGKSTTTHKDLFGTNISLSYFLSPPPLPAAPVAHSL